MFEKKVREISLELGEKTKKEFLILTHKLNRREIYFSNNGKSIEFIKNKFNSFPKKIIYFLLRIGLMKIFLKKIKLSSKLGDVIYVANQIKSFNIDKKEVFSFLKEGKKESFLVNKELQRNISKKGFAPRIIEINKNIPFSREELLEGYNGKDDNELFKRLLSYYSIYPIKKIDLSKYFELLIRRVNERNIKINQMDKIKKFIKNYSRSTKLDLVMSHGSFTKEQILVRDNYVLFTDWEDQKEDLIVGDLVNYFRNENNLLKNKNFLKILNLYPEEIRKKITLYLIINEINLILKRGFLKIHKKRLKNLI
jgi:hypothetical protein